MIKAITKTFHKIGISKINSLMFVGPNRIKKIFYGLTGWNNNNGEYFAIVTDNKEDIGDDYEKVFTTNRWLKVYDDSGCSATIRGARISVYRRGRYDTLILKEGV